MSVWRFIPVVVFVLIGFFFWRGLSLDPQRLPSVKIGQKLPTFNLRPLETSEPHLTNQTFNKQFTLLNIWASWCSSCQEEQVFLLQLAREGVVIYGVNYKDHPRAAKKWLKEWGNPYRRIGLDKEGKLGIELGVYGTPETFLIDAQGVIRYRQVGIMTPLVWKKAFLPIIQGGGV